MRTIIVSLAILALCAGVASAKIQTETATQFTGPNRVNTMYEYFDMSDATGFVTIDETATFVPHWHIDNFAAHMYDATDYWYCGSFAYDANGGYGFGWDDRLVVPVTDCSTAFLPVLTFAHYYDSELGWDYSYVQAKQGGAWVDLAPGGFTGIIPGGTWSDFGVSGYSLGLMDQPVEVRFRCLSDGNTCDQDGGYDSVGGMYRVDNIKIFDYYGASVYFLDNANTGGLCTPAIPGAAGDWWHLVNDVCSSNVIPSWWCGDDADSSLIPPNLANTLITPAADCSAAVTCTLRFATHAEVPTIDNDYWVNNLIVDGTTYYLSAFWGDFGTCDGFGSAGLIGYDISGLMPSADVKYSITFYTTDNGCGPGAGGAAGINCDDTWFEGSTEPISPVTETSWGKIKRMYR